MSSLSVNTLNLDILSARSLASCSSSCEETPSNTRKPFSQDEKGSPSAITEADLIVGSEITDLQLEEIVDSKKRELLLDNNVDIPPETEREKAARVEKKLVKTNNLKIKDNRLNILDMESILILFCL